MAVEGKVTIIWRGDEVKRAVHGAGRIGLFEFAHHILEEAKRLVPKDTGDLRNDSGVSPSADGLTMTVWFGAQAASSYAVRQHEETGYHHLIGQAKYLETPLKEHAGEMTGVLASKLKQPLEG